MDNSVLTAVRQAPFNSEIASNGYYVKDNRGYVWAVCRDEGYANVIVEALHALVREWKSQDNDI
jgi:hypothetical protein